jgi:hypothetical protein
MGLLVIRVVALCLLAFTLKVSDDLGEDGEGKGRELWVCYQTGLSLRNLFLNRSSWSYKVLYSPYQFRQDPCFLGLRPCSFMGLIDRANSSINYFY